MTVLDASLTQTYHDLLVQIGEDPSREGLQKTPERAAKAMQFLVSGYEQDVSEVINGAVFTSQAKEMVVVKDVEFYSLCEHHLLPFFGKCHIGYLPDGKVLGLSKVARIVDVFARRLQIQEELTYQIAHAIEEAIGAKGVCVAIQASHLCMKMRGVESECASMFTTAMLGQFEKEPEKKIEFLRFLG